MYYYIKVEPYWNVNVTSPHNSEFNRLIKVEPYWNVNFLYAVPFLS